jgi:hypothetical protein
MIIDLSPLTTIKDRMSLISGDKLREIPDDIIFRLIEGRYFEGNKMLIFLYFELINL